MFRVGSQKKGTVMRAQGFPHCDRGTGHAGERERGGHDIQDLVELGKKFNLQRNV